jgi:hypothetical protein
MQFIKAAEKRVNIGSNDQRHAMVQDATKSFFVNTSADRLLGNPVAAMAIGPASRP